MGLAVAMEVVMAIILEMLGDFALDHCTFRFRKENNKFVNDILDI